MYRTLLAALLLLVAAGISSAQTIVDPSDLFIGTGFGTACATGCGTNASPTTLITGNTLSIYLNGMGHPFLSNPLILILGVGWNSVTGSLPIAPTINGATYYAGNSGSGVATSISLILGGPGYNGADGELTASDPSPRNAYSEAGYDHTANASNNFTNWSGMVGPGIDSFALYAYRINQSIQGGDLLDLIFGGAPTNTFAIAYACDSNGTPNDALDGVCAGGAGVTYTTPFTQAGFFSSTGGGGGSTGGGGGSTGVVPEPTSILLMGTMGLLVGAFSKKKLRH